VRCFHRSADADDARLEHLDGHAGDRDQLIGRLEDIEDGGETEIEHMIESEDIDAHGKYCTKSGVLANSTIGSAVLTSALWFFPTQNGEVTMLKVSLFVRLEAKPGKEGEVAAFLKQGLELANAERTTPVWFALQLGPSSFAVFDAFESEAGREAHLNGPIAKALMAQAPILLASAPTIERIEVLGAKVTS